MSMPTSLPSWDAWDAGLVGHASVNASEALRAMAQFESPFAGQKYGFATHGDLNPIIDHCLSGAVEAHTPIIFRPRKEERLP